MLTLVLAALLWSEPTITYRFDASVGPVERSAFHAALELWSSESLPLTYRETEDQWFTAALWWLGLDHSVLVRVDAKLPSFGRTTLGAGVRRELVFNPRRSTPAWLEVDLAHEWGHVLGLTHEHQRSDRDRYVTIPAEFLAKLSTDRAADYAINPDDSGAVKRPYDYLSLMHYSSNIDGNRMIRKDTGALIPGALGPSAGDWARLHQLYARTPQEAP